MNTSTAGSETRQGYWRRVLRPFFWWLLLVLALFGVHQHQLAMERTRIYFSVTMYRTNTLYDAVATLDGHPIVDGGKISLGLHRLTITQAKANNFNTNFFAWYGPHDLGRRNLERAMGTLNVSAEATAKEITVSGPEFETTFYNSIGTNLLVPTDTYQVRARYRRWSDARDLTVTAENTAKCAFAPQLSVLSISADKSPATYELWGSTANMVEKGDLPAFVTEIPAGPYSVLVHYHNHTLKHEIKVSNIETNEVSFHFAFGAARFDSTPTGADVYTPSGEYLGTTPVLVEELIPSTSNYRLQLNGYDTAIVSGTVVENRTNAVSATLVSLSYFGSMRNAKRDMEARNYKNALASIALALSAKPGDTDALSLQTTAKGRQLVQTAKDQANQGRYIEAGKKLQEALAALPDDTEATSLQTDYKAHESEELSAQKEDRVRAAFKDLCFETPNAELFRANEYRTDHMTPEQMRDALIMAYTNQIPKATVSFERTPSEGIYEIFFVQAPANPLEMARREMPCVIGSSKDGQTLILFKCLEYQRGSKIDLGGLLLHGKGAEWIPLHPSRIQITPALEEQVRFGVRLMIGKLDYVTENTNN